MNSVAVLGPATDEDVVIRAQSLSKTYRLYSKPHHRLWDMFGLLPRGRYSEHSALDGVNLTIRRGEKLGLIGRNGAGKSTLLKLITRVVEPTSGTLEVKGTPHALLSIGTGFHPDFTGRENVYTYLMSQGVVGHEADDLARRIIDFAELDEYIDQPVKTYSTGMGMRLMFATSTIITPDILIIDEVLGVGDAYFVQKSLEHMRRICSSQGTTMLLVSHDIYTTSQLCERIVWIDRGRILMDGPAQEVIKAYEASIRLQEEDRLRRRALEAREGERAKADGDVGRVLYCQIVPKDRRTQHPGLDVGSIRLLSGGECLADVPMDGSTGLGGGKLVLEEKEGNWGTVSRRAGQFVRRFETYGSARQRAPFVFRVPVDMVDLVLEVEAAPRGELPYYVEIYSLDCETVCVELSLVPAGGLQQLRMPFALVACGAQRGRQQVLGLASQGQLAQCGSRFGSKRLVIRDVCILGEGGERQHVFACGDAMTLQFLIDVVDRSYDAMPEIMISLLKGGTLPVTRFFHDRKRFHGESVTSVVVQVRFDSLLLCSGEYGINIAIYNEGYYENSVGTHIACSCDVIDVLRNAVFFKVESASIRHQNISFVHPVAFVFDS